MEKKKNEFDDDDFWLSSHKGYNFELDRQSTASALMRKDEFNQLDLLKCDGYTEVVENKSVKETVPFRISQQENEKYASKFAQKFSPFVNKKRRVEIIKCGPEETVKNMILGLEYSLDTFKGKREKIALLNAAVKSHDGNTILEVVLHLRKSLKKSIFQREIVAYPDAVNVYLAYLEEDHESDELANMLLLLDKGEEAAILKYETAVISQHPDRKLKRIENCLSTHFQLGVTGTFLRKSVEEHKQILEEQLKLEEYYNQIYPANERENLAEFEKLTGKKTVIDSSILCNLIFCCLYFHKSCELSFACPEKIKSHYNLSKKQYTWAILRGLVAAKRWLEIDNLFMSKKWLGGTKMQSCITISRIIEVLFKAEAPNEVLKKYISCIENEHEKLNLAKKYACHSIVIEVLKNNKDRIALEGYKTSLIPYSADFFLAADVLKNQMIRWKN